MTMATKQDIINAQRPAYLKANRKEKGRILESIALTTGLQRKAVIQRFRRPPARPSGGGKRRERRRLYGSDITLALREVWQVENEICGERLHPQIPECVSVLIRDQMWTHTAEMTQQLLRMSQATVKRRVTTFEKARGRRRGRATTKPSNLKEIIPIRRGPWQNPDPGFGEVDTVAHCGMTLTGDYSYSVQWPQFGRVWLASGTRGKLPRLKASSGLSSICRFPCAALTQTPEVSLLTGTAKAGVMSGKLL